MFEHVLSYTGWTLFGTLWYYSPPIMTMYLPTKNIYKCRPGPRYIERPLYIVSTVSPQLVPPYSNRSV